jgi:hypothetical protein
MIQKKKTEAEYLTISDFELGWLVGIVEGEGSISCRYNRKSGYLCAELTVSSTDEDTIDRLHSIYPGKSTYTKKYKNHFKEQYIWAVTSRQGIRTILNIIYPHMGKRRKERIEQVLFEFNNYEQNLK